MFHGVNFNKFYGQVLVFITNIVKSINILYYRSSFYLTNEAALTFWKECITSNLRVFLLKEVLKISYRLCFKIPSCSSLFFFSSNQLLILLPEPVVEVLQCCWGRLQTYLPFAKYAPYHLALLRYQRSIRIWLCW
jgi:hypothetical protein